MFFYLSAVLLNDLFRILGNPLEEWSVIGDDLIGDGRFSYKNRSAIVISFDPKCGGYFEVRGVADSAFESVSDL